MTRTRSGPVRRSTTRSPGYAEKLVKTGEDIEREFGIPIVNKRISVTPMALVAGASETEDCVPFALALDRAAQTCGINFIGGYSALVQKGMTEADEKLIRSIPEALARTELVCSSVNVGVHPGGHQYGRGGPDGPHRQGYRCRHGGPGWPGCAKLVVFCNAVEDNPFMAGRLPRRGRGGEGHNVGVSGPGVVCTALKAVKGQPFDVVAETVKKTAFPGDPHGPVGGPGGPAVGWTRPSASWISPWRLPRPSETAWPAFWRRWAWRSAAPTALRRRWPC